VRQPSYATISYTWGRYVALEGKVIPITGVPWRLPGVHSEHFTVENFTKTIDAIGNICQVDFLWLDVACVDMTDWSADDNEEISLQRDIFRGAAQSFVWLSRTETSSLASILEHMRDVVNLVTSIQVEDSDLSESTIHLLKQATPIFDQLLADPWFSSLWTLQEAMASPNSILLSAEGHALSLPTGGRGRIENVSGCILKDEDRTVHGLDLPYEPLTSGTLGISGLTSTSYVTLLHLVYLSQSIRDAANFLATSPTQAATDLSGLRHRIENSGLSSFASFNLLHMWKVAQHRNEMHTGDRLEYIQTHVLGYPSEQAASPPPDPHIHFGDEFVYHFPVLSQLFVRNKIGRSLSCSWHFDTDSIFPELDFLFTCFQQYIPLVETRRATHSDGATYVGFTGQTYSSMPALESLISPASRTSPTKPKLLGIALDEYRITTTAGLGPIIPAMCALPTKQPLQSPDSPDIWTMSLQHMNQALDALRQQVRHGSDIRLLPLAYSPAHEKSGPCLVIAAIVLSLGHEEKWKRLGWCFWAYSPSDRPSDGLDAQSEDISYFGIFGISRLDVIGIYV
jgi:hypothetical protein